MTNAMTKRVRFGGLYREHSRGFAEAGVGEIQAGGRCAEHHRAATILLRGMEQEKTEDGF